MYETAAMATTVTITPISQRPRLLSVCSVDSRPSPPPSSVPPPTPPIVNHEAYMARSDDSFSDTIPSPKGIKLPHTRYIPIRSQSSTVVPSTYTTRPSLGRAPHSATAASPFPLSASRSMDGLRRSEDEELWSRPLGNYSFCHSYEAACSTSTTNSRSGSRQSNHSKLGPSKSASSSSSSQPGNRKAKSRGRSDGDGEHFSGWFKNLWRRQ